MNTAGASPFRFLSHVVKVWLEAAICLAVLVRVEVNLRRRAPLAELALQGFGRSPQTVVGVVSLSARQMRSVRVVDTLFSLWPWKGTCLRRSLVLMSRLTASSPRLRVGVRRDSGRMTAHAWVEIDGVSWDPEARRYEPLDLVDGGL